MLIGVIFVMVLWLHSIIMYGMTFELLVSITAIAILLLLLRMILRGRVSAGVIHGLWLLLALRLLLCVVFVFVDDSTAPEGAWSVERLTNSAIHVWQEKVETVETKGGDIREDNKIEPAKFEIGTIRLRLWIRGIWLLGSIAFLMLFAFLNERFRRKIYKTRRRLSLKHEYYPVYCVPQLFSPCVLSIRREKAIYLTEEIAEDEEKRKYVIAHEACHIKNHDIFWAAVRNFVLACFWFHPLIWMAAIYSKRDNEMVCDERAIQMLGEGERKNYGQVLLDMVDNTNRKEDIFYLATTMTAGKREIYHRIRLITKGKKSQVLSAISFLVIGVILVCTCFTSYAGIDGLSEEETIRQYLYYDSQHYEKGKQRLYPYAPDRDSFWMFSGYSNEAAQGLCSIEETQMKGDFTDWVPEAETYSELKWYQVKVIRRHRIWNEEKADFVGKKRVKKEYALLGKVTAEDDWRIVYWMEE